MTPEQYRENCHRTRNGDLSLTDQRLNAGMGLGEAGELQNVVKKEVFHGHPEDAFKVLDEAGDVLYYLDWLLDTYGWTMENAMRANVHKLAERYPNGFDPERSLNRQHEEKAETL